MNPFARLTMKARLAWTFGGLAGLIAGIAALSMHALDTESARFRDYLAGIDAQAGAAHQARTAVDRRAIAARNLVLVDRPEDLAQEKTRVATAHRDVQQRLADLQRLAAAADVPAESRRRVERLAQIEAAYAPVALAIVELAGAGRRDAAIAKMNAECRPLLDALVQAAEEFDAHLAQQARAVLEASESRTATLHVVQAGGSLVGLLLAVVAGVLITRSLVRALGAEPAQLAAAARRVAEGELDALAAGERAPEGSVLASLAAMQQGLARIVRSVREASQSIAVGSAEIAGGSTHLSQRTESQASALQQTAATMEQLGDTVRQNAASAERADQLAAGASRVAERGGSVVAEVVRTMQGIHHSSKRISDIIGVIDGIAFQTNILALNAAVEAARAGEQGRGFAVVAGEVRSLAQRSAEAAREIKSLIGSSVEQVDRGAELVDRAGRTMDEIVDAIRKVSGIVGEISAASSAQSSGVRQVGEAVSQMDRNTQQNAALVEQSAAAAASLKEQADQLVAAVGVFKLSQA